jgi:hypothetical protein
MMRQETFSDYQAKFTPPSPPEQVSDPYVYVILLPLFFLLTSWHPYQAKVMPEPVPAAVIMHNLTPETPGATISPRVEYLFDVIEAAAIKFGTDATLARSVCREETHFNEFAISPAGARGLFQHMPEYQDEHVRKYLHRNPARWHWWDAEDSAALGCAMLAAFTKQSGTWGGVCSFNCGPGRFHELRYGRALPAETYAFASKVMGGLND